MSEQLVPQLILVRIHLHGLAMSPRPTLPTRCDQRTVRIKKAEGAIRKLRGGSERERVNHGTAWQVQRDGYLR